MIKTPIIFTLEEFVEESKDPIIPIPISTLQVPVTKANILSLVTSPIQLAPRYYIKIKPPSIIRNDADYLPRIFTYNIPWQGIYKDQVRLNLPPTIGWGEGSCYTVEYWQWQPMIFPLSYKRPPLKHRIIKTEHWLVPHPYLGHLLNHQEIRTSFKHPTISLTSTLSPISLLNYPLIQNIVAIDSPTTKPVIYSVSNVVAIDSSLTSNALIQAAVNYKNTTDVLLTTNIPVGESFTVEYVKPIDVKQVLFTNSLFPQNTYVNN